MAKTPEIKVGIFVVVGALIVGYMFFVLSPDTFQKISSKKYYTVVKNASGIVLKTHVKTNGVIVGKVKEVKLLSNSTRIDFEVASYINIPDGSKIAIKEKGLLGDVFLEIIRSDDTGVYLDNGAFLPPSEDQVNISTLINVFGAIGKDIKQFTSTLSEVFGGEQGKEHTSNLFADLATLTKELKIVVSENRGSIKSLVENVALASQDLRDLVGGTQGDIRNLIKNFERSSHEIAEILVAAGDANLKGTFASLATGVRDFEATAGSLKSIAGQIDRGEGTIGRLVHDDKIIDDVHGTLKDIKKLVQPASKLQVHVNYKGEVRHTTSTQHYFDVVLRTRPDRFYMIGVTDHLERSVDTTKEQVSSPDASPTSTSTPVTERERIRTQEQLRFNLQFGRRWNNFQVRFGLFETTGGLATDLYFFRDRFRLSLEAFNWDSEDGQRKVAHFKSYARFLFFDHLYAFVGVDDITRTKTLSGSTLDPRYFIGAGVTFSDDDLKTVVTAAAAAL